MKCRHCKTILDLSILNIGKSAIANDFLRKRYDSINQKKFKLDLVLCKKCLLIQHNTNIKSELLYSKYSYFSSYSKDTLLHAKNFANQISKKLKKNSSILEIACNDGYLLKNFNKKKFDIVGVEPAKNVSIVAKNKGIKVYNNFFDLGFAKKLSKKYNFDFIICNNVIAHISNINSFFAGLNEVSNLETIISIEFQHALSLLKNNQYDTIYHEHYYYHTLKSLKKILSKFNLKIFDCSQINTHGGSLRIFCSKLESNNKVSKEIQRLLNKENVFIFNRITNTNYYQKIFEKNIIHISSQIKNIKLNGNIVGFGAAAKTSTFTNILKLSSETIDYIIDDTPYKQNRYIPGSDIKIISFERAFNQFDEPNYIIIFAWNYLESIKKRIRKKFKKSKFVVLVPEFKIIK